MADTIAPVAVWDARDKSWWKPPLQPARAGWLWAHDLPADDIYRIEFYLIDVPFARLFCYHRNAEGRRHLTDAHTPGQPHNHDLCEIAVEEPRDVLLSELPPARLLGGALSRI